MMVDDKKMIVSIGYNKNFRYDIQVLLIECLKMCWISTCLYQGGHAGWGGQNNSDGPGDSYMLQVRGTNQLNTKAVQVSTYL